MSVSINITAHSSKESEQFKRHYQAVEMCIKLDLSFPIETQEFFKGSLDGEDLNDIRPEYILNMLQYGISVELPLHAADKYSQSFIIKVSEIPKSVDRILVELR